MEFIFYNVQNFLNAMFTLLQDGGWEKTKKCEERSAQVLSICSRCVPSCGREDGDVYEIGTMLGIQGSKEGKMGVRGPENV